MAKCRIDSFRLRGTGSMCHIFLLTLNSLMRVGFGFSSVTFRSRVFHSRVFSHHSVDTDEQLATGSCPHFYQTLKMWQMSLNAFISLLYKQLLQYTLFHCTSRFINQIPKEVPCETFSISFHFHKIVHENTFALTLPCFIWVSRAIAKHTRVVLTAFCQCSRLIVNGITEI